LKTFGSNLESFKGLPKPAKAKIRADTIEGISRECHTACKAGIVTGHYSFWSANGDHEVAMIEADKKAYTHILYLKPSPETIVEQVAKDTARQRLQLDAATVRQWQEFEEEQLRSICRGNNILFMTIQPEMLSQTAAIAEILKDGAHHDEATNASVVNKIIDGIMQSRPTSNVKTMLVLDADHTLAPYDASTLYWQLSSNGEINPLKDLFQSPLGYSYTAFRQATWLYEQHAVKSANAFALACRQAASRITVHPQMLALLRRACADKTVGVIVVTCGLKPVWDKVLEALDLSATVPIIGNGFLSNGYVVTPKTKADTVAHLQHHHKLYVCVIGDSEVDLPMLKKANQAVVVVGSGSSRSKSFDEKLQNAIVNEGLRACQVLLPSDSIPRLDSKILPTAELDDAFVTALITKDCSLKIYDASEKPASKLLASSTRNVNVSGLALQQAHENAGWYLATEYISQALGVEPFDFITVQDKTTQGHRLVDDSKTLIVPLMRGGDPIARGVFRAFPAAMYHHSKQPEQLEPKHVAGKNTIILADWVINTGQGMVEFVKHIRENLSGQVRIVMVAGVVQEQVVGKDGVEGVFARDLKGMGDVTLVTLRVSKNQYKGTGVTDTGHRLFNSTHLD
jgi:uracil phosphoribosyltransferase/phosphoserine phosphatase